MTDENPIEVKVKRERHVRAFAELSHANWILLENMRQRREGWFYECMTTILMSAFKCEAYLNHVGEKILPSWAGLERRPHGVKLKSILSQLNIQINDSERPYQTLIDLFWFRNTIAHGRDEHLDPPEANEVGPIETLRRKKPLTRWEEQCTPEFAERAYKDTEQIIRELHSAAGLPKADLRRSGHSYIIAPHRATPSANALRFTREQDASSKS